MYFSTRSISSETVNSSSIVNLVFPSCIFNCDFTNPINRSKNLPCNGAFVKFKSQSTPNFHTKFCVSSAVKFDPWFDTISFGQPLLETNLQKLFIIAPAP